MNIATPMNMLANEVRVIVALRKSRSGTIGSAARDSMKRKIRPSTSAAGSMT